MAEPSIAAQVVALTHLNITELRQRWLETFGTPTTQRHRVFLIKRLAWKLQADAIGTELSPEAKQRLDTLQEEFRTSPPSTWFRNARHNRAPAPTGPKGPPPVRAAKSPKPGSIITRQYRGEQIVVTVRREREFEYRGQIYKSLSAVATAITGGHCSGPAFFKQKKEPR